MISSKIQNKILSFKYKMLKYNLNATGLHLFLEHTIHIIPRQLIVFDFHCLLTYNTEKSVS